jgi:hypothetical protein
LPPSSIHKSLQKRDFLTASLHFDPNWRKGIFDESLMLRLQALLVTTWFITPRIFGKFAYAKVSYRPRSPANAPQIIIAAKPSGKAGLAQENCGLSARDRAAGFGSSFLLHDNSGSTLVCKPVSLAVA